MCPTILRALAKLSGYLSYAPNLQHAEFHAPTAVAELSSLLPSDPCDPFHRADQNTYAVTQQIAVGRIVRAHERRTQPGSLAAGVREAVVSRPVRTFNNRGRDRSDWVVNWVGRRA